jgi:hypothetical protein
MGRFAHGRGYHATDISQKEKPSKEPAIPETTSPPEDIETLDKFTSTFEGKGLTEE